MRAIDILIAMACGVVGSLLYHYARGVVMRVRVWWFRWRRRNEPKDNATLASVTAIYKNLYSPESLAERNKRRMAFLVSPIKYSTIEKAEPANEDNDG